VVDGDTAGKTLGVRKFKYGLAEEADQSWAVTGLRMRLFFFFQGGFLGR